MLKHIFLHQVRHSWAIMSLLLLSACTSITPRIDVPVAVETPVFSHELFDRVLHRVVNSQGRVDYQSLQAQADDFETYYLLISQYSPDSHAELFPTEQHRLTYWINAYNAAVIKTVLEYYPIKSIADVKPPTGLFFLSDKTGFFFFQRPQFGGVHTSLYYLENGVIRDRFTEPRIHFALNCASRGCPKLPNKAFKANTLEQQLQQEAYKFFAEPRNLRLDPEQNILYVSSILDWFEEDFTDWYQQRYPDQIATLMDYISLYAQAELADEIRQRKPTLHIEFIAYDWKLNDQAQ